MQENNKLCQWRKSPKINEPGHFYSRRFREKFKAHIQPSALEKWTSKEIGKGQQLLQAI